LLRRRRSQDIDVLVVVVVTAPNAPAGEELLPAFVGELVPEAC
jgi:hypothetical protein